MFEYTLYEDLASEVDISPSGSLCNDIHHKLPSRQLQARKRTVAACLTSCEKSPYQYERGQLDGRYFC